MTGRQMKNNLSVQKEMAEVSQSPLVKVTDCYIFAGKETEQHYSWCLWCREMEGKKERERW